MGIGDDLNQPVIGTSQIRLKTIWAGMGLQSLKHESFAQNSKNAVSSLAQRL